MARRSISFWGSFTERTGQPFDFRRHGYMFLLPSPETVRHFTAAVEMQRSLGVDAQLLDPSEVGDVFPGVRTEDLLPATYCPSDGSASPADAVAGFAKAARAYGAEVRHHTEFLGLVCDGDSAVTGVATTRGR